MNRPTENKPVQDVMYELTVKGQHNPFIHTDEWYGENDILDDGKTFRGDSYVSSKFDDCRISCDFTDWELHFANIDMADSMAEIVRKVFRGLLSHTPVTQVNFSIVRAVENPPNPSPVFFGLGALRPRVTGHNFIHFLDENDQNEAIQTELWTCDDDDHQFHIQRSLTRDLDIESDGDSQNQIELLCRCIDDLYKVLNGLRIETEETINEVRRGS